MLIYLSLVPYVSIPSVWYLNILESWQDIIHVFPPFLISSSLPPHTKTHNKLGLMNTMISLVLDAVLSLTATVENATLVVFPPSFPQKHCLSTYASNVCRSNNCGHKKKLHILQQNVLLSLVDEKVCLINLLLITCNKT